MTNFTQISFFFKTQFPLNEHGLDELFSLFKITYHKKNMLLLKEKSKEKQLRFLNKGSVIEYYTIDGKERNINFYIKPQFISDLLAFNQNTTTNKNQECLSDVEVLTIERQPFLNLLEKYQCGKSIITSSFEKLLKQKELFEYNRITKTPEELYKELFIYKPNWLQTIPQYHIASYLNITPETLSRISKRIS